MSSSLLTVTPADLVKVWSLSKASESRQMTLRIPSDVFYKLQVLEEMFPSRSRNEMVSDLLTTALTQFVEGLPTQRGACMGLDHDGEPVYEETGPGMEFWALYRKYRDASGKPSDSSGEDKSVDLTVVKVGEESKEAA